MYIVLIEQSKELKCTACNSLLKMLIILGAFVQRLEFYNKTLQGARSQYNQSFQPLKNEFMFSPWFTEQLSIYIIIIIIFYF